MVLSPAGDPLRLVYRDLADIRVSPARLARHGMPAPELPERILTDDGGAAPQAVRVAGGGRAGGDAGFRCGPARGAGGRRTHLPRTADLTALFDEPLPVKALTLMRASPGHSGDRWAELPNPLR
ncbi:IucA/IucC family siderophore biosynthesis protein OS=Streptomyces tendae OX=1932 GN=F3L20_13325 PE=3 SV=1 [Streptomyces tendae]